MRLSDAKPPRARRLRVSLFFLVCVASCAGGACRQPAASAPRVVLDAGDGQASHATIKIVGLSPRDAAALRSRAPNVEEWRAIVRVAVAAENGDGAPDASVPQMAGTYAVGDADVVFTPMFGLDPGRRYYVAYSGPDGSHASGVVSLPKRIVDPSTIVDRVYPSGDVWPENQLRLYIHFSAPMGMKGGLDYVQLLDDGGRRVKDPFLPVAAEFWNADRTRFTMFFDPGRVKRGILPNEQMGRPLTAGRRYTLVVSREWTDAQGLPLKEEFRRAFSAGPVDMRPIDPKAWRLQPPPAGRRDPLVVTFPEPLDHGLLMRALGVSDAGGTPMTGDGEVGAGETEWRFTPRDAWPAGDYRLVVLTILEDPAGNRIGRAFEVDQFDRVDRSREAESITLRFSVGSRR